LFHTWRLTRESSKQAQNAQPQSKAEMRSTTYCSFCDVEFTWREETHKGRSGMYSESMTSYYARSMRSSTLKSILRSQWHATTKPLGDKCVAIRILRTWPKSYHRYGKA